MIDPFPQTRRDKEIISKYYNPDFYQNIKNLLGGYNEALMEGRSGIFRAYWIFEHIVFLCKYQKSDKDKEKKIDIPSKLFNEFEFYMRGVEKGSDNFVFDKKSDRVNFVPLMKLVRHERVLRMMDKEINMDRLSQENLITGFYSMEGNKKSKVDKINVFEYNNLIDRVLIKLKPVVVEVELIIQKKLETLGYGMIESFREFETESQLE